MTETLERISIFWENDSDELVAMMRELNDPGVTVGNDGAEIAVTSDEYQDVLDYAHEHPGITVEHHGQISAESARTETLNW